MLEGGKGGFNHRGEEWLKSELESLPNLSSYSWHREESTLNFKEVLDAWNYALSEKEIDYSEALTIASAYLIGERILSMGNLRRSILVPGKVIFSVAVVIGRTLLTYLRDESLANKIAKALPYSEYAFKMGIYYLTRLNSVAKGNVDKMCNRRFLRNLLKRLSNRGILIEVNGIYWCHTGPIDSYALARYGEQVLEDIAREIKLSTCTGSWDMEMHMMEELEKLVSRKLIIYNVKPETSYVWIQRDRKLGKIIVRCKHKQIGPLRASYELRHVWRKSLSLYYVS